MKLRTLLALRCPVCEKAKVFHGYLDTPERCPACGFYFMREAGYFLPHAPIGYLATAAAAFSAWPMLRFAFGVESDPLVLGGMIAFGLAFGLWFNRYAKMIWLTIDLKIHPPTREDFEARGRTTR